MDYDIIVVAGQSNADGYGWGDVQNPYQLDPRILQLVDPQEINFVKNEQGVDVLRVIEPWQFYVEEAKERENSTRKFGNFALQFAQEYINHGFLQNGRKILVVKAAVGGTGFAKGHWVRGGVLYRRMIDMIDFAVTGPDNRIVAFLWHQGEHDAFENEKLMPSERYAFYKDKLFNLIKSVRERYSSYTFPFIAGEFVLEWWNKNQDNCQAVLNATKDICEIIGNAAMVSSKELLSNNQKNGDGDDVHFCREALYELGKRYFSAFESIRIE